MLETTARLGIDVS